MSRIGKKPVSIPSGVELKIQDGVLSAKGAKGELSLTLHPSLNAVIEDAEGGGKQARIVLKQDSPEKKDLAIWGLYGSLLRNLILGVKEGFERRLELVGVGFKVASKGESLELEVGFSHSVNFFIPKGISAKVEKNIITISGVDKHLVGSIAAQLRSIKPPEPYKGKGIKYSDEVIRRKAGKAAKAGAAAK